MLDSYLEKWQLSHPHPLTQTHTSHIYTVIHNGETVILKLLKPLGLDDEKNGAVALRHFDGHGAVRLLQADNHAHLLEYANGDDLVRLVNQGDDELATNIMADVLNQFHSLPLPAHLDGLTTLRRWFRSLFNKAREQKEQGIVSIFTRATDVAENLLSHPQDICVLHGDIHHENIRYHHKRGWLAFDPKGLVGERTFDAANILCNPTPEIALSETRFDKHTAILAQKMGIDQKRITSFAYVYACLSVCWSLEDNQDANLAFGVATIAEQYLVKSE